ncbi:MAG: extracellular solute-binding protein [Oscillospiraceae bacterium]|nr:extracellular solute-binding protein [Oscillospiraceae bacterium]
MKKFLAIVLSVLMLVALVACGATTTTETPPVEAETPAPTPAQTPDEDEEDDEPAGGTLTVWCWDPTFNIFAMEEAARIYAEMNPGFELNIVDMAWDDIQIALTTAATAGNLDVLPDIVLMQDNAFQMNVINFPELFLDLTNSGIPFNEFAAAKAGMSMVNGNNFGVPFDNGTTITALRTDVLEEAGYTMEDFENVTWNEFIELGRSVLAQTGMPLLATEAGGGDYIAFMLQSAGVSLFNADGSPNIADNAALIEAINVYLELVESGVVLEVNNWDEYIGSFVNGTVAGTIAGCWILGSVQSADDQAGNWGVMSIPRLDIPGGTNYSNWGGSSWAVTSNANAELAIDFLRHTFAGSTELYEVILPAAGALSTWAPAANSTVYAEPQPFFGGQAVFADIVRFSGNVPAITTGVFFYEARDAVGFAVVDILGGADIEQALQEAQDLLVFQIG